MRAKTINEVNFEKNRNPKKTLGLELNPTKAFQEDYNDILKKWDKFFKNLVGKTVEGKMWKTLHGTGGMENEIFKFKVKEVQWSPDFSYTSEIHERIHLKVYFTDDDKNRYELFTQDEIIIS